MDVIDEAMSKARITVIRGHKEFQPVRLPESDQEMVRMVGERAYVVPSEEQVSQSQWRP